jgi:hypothetical protein
MKRLFILITLPFVVASGLLAVGTIALIKKIEEDYDDEHFWE